MKVDLEQMAQEFLDTYYPGLALTIPIIISGRLTRAFGHFKIDGQGQPLHIALAKRLFNEENRHLIQGTLYHELVHYACFVKKMPYHDGQPSFERELVRCQAPATKTRKYADQVELKVHFYGCTKCQLTYTRRRKLASTDSEGRLSSTHRCQCRAKLRYQGYKKFLG